MKLRESVFNEKISWIGTAYKDRVKSTTTSTPIETVYFLLNFELESNDKISSELIISAHSRYKLYVNDEFVTFGPCKSSENYRHYERLEISKHLKEGQNKILVKVVSFPARECEVGGNTGPFWAHNKSCGCCLFAAGEVESGGKTISLSTGVSDWQYSINTEMTPVKDDFALWLGYKEDVDGKKYTKELNSLEWKKAINMFSANTSPYGEMSLFPMYEREIPLLYTNQKKFTKTDIETEGCVIPANSKKVFLLDAGEHTTGFPRIALKGGEGSVVTIRYAEAFFHEENGKYIKRKRDDSSGVIYGHEDIYRPANIESLQIYEPFWFRTFRYIEITIETSNNSLQLVDAYYVETGYPLQAVTELSDINEDWLVHVWNNSLRTLRRCMHETYEDCPYYEQLQYTMDTRLQMLFTYAVSGDTRLPRKTIHEFHSSKLPNGILQSRYPSSTPQVIPIFSLHWIFMLDDYYNQTSDKNYLRGYLGTVDQILHYFRSCKKDGLSEDLGYWEYVDWTPEWDDNRGVPHACINGASTIQNLQYAYALKVAAKIMRIFGFYDLATSYKDECEEIKKTVMDKCWNGKLFKEGPNFDGEYSQLAQLWAILCEMGTKEIRAKLLKEVLNNDSLIKCSYPTMFYTFRAFEQEGLYEETAPLWDYWKVLLPLGLTTIPEISFGSPRSDCHAWGSILLYEFPRNILGVQQSAAGFSEICVEPKGFYIEKASGTVFVPSGNINVVRIVKDKELHLEITPNCPQSVKVLLPNGTSHIADNYKTTSYISKIN